MLFRSSGNTGECDPWRYTSDMFVNETIEQITGSFPHWFHPRLRFFAGREHKLPVDQNSLMAMVAPRGLLMYSSFSESQGNSFGFEQGYRSVRRVYQFLGRPGNVGLHLRAGEHPTTAGDLENFLDFFDTVFGRKSFPRFETFLHGYTFAGWQRLSGETAATLKTPPAGADAREKIRWALGEEPAGLRFPAVKEPGRTMTSDGWLAGFHRRPVEAPGMASRPLSFGDDLSGGLYYPAAVDGSPLAGKRPAVVWLHPFSYPTGYSRNFRATLEMLGKRGFVVFAFDQLGFGTRVEYAGRFYQRYPRWSLMGKMAADTSAAVEALAELDMVDASKIWLAGWALGGKVALITAALDERVAGVAAIAAFTPLRTAGAHPDLEGAKMYSHLHGLLPRLGFFVGRESRLPVDYDDILGAIAPRPVLVVAPQLDRYAPVAEVRRAVETARARYKAAGRENALAIETPLDFNRLPAATQELVFDWLAAQ